MSELVTNSKDFSIQDLITDGRNPRVCIVFCILYY